MPCRHKKTLSKRLRRYSLQLTGNVVAYLNGGLAAGGLVSLLGFEHDLTLSTEFDLSPALICPLNSGTMIPNSPAILLHNEEGSFAPNSTVRRSLQTLQVQITEEDPLKLFTI